MKRLLQEIWSWGKAFAAAFVIALLINTFVLQTYKVQGQSMMPNVHENDYAIIYKLAQAYDYNDIVIVDSRVQRDRSVRDSLNENALLSLISRNSDQHLWIKRVIGKPNDQLEFRNNKLYRNGEVLDEPYINEQMRNNPNHIIQVPEGQLFVMGDNRNHSSDSRVVGSIPKDHIVGKVVYLKSN